MVAQHLAALLRQKDEVIIPDLGTFSATYAHAEVHPVSHSFTPPSKLLNFNAALKMSNGLFEKEISKRMSISKVEAEEEVKQFVSTLKINLGIHKKYVIDGLGDFQLLHEDQIEFKQNKEAVLWEESFGLPEIFAKPIERSKEELNAQQAANKKVKKNKTEQKKPLPTAQPARKVSLGSAIAIGSLALVATWVGLVLFVNDNLNPFKYFTSSSQVDIDAPPKFDQTDVNVVDAQGKVNVDDDEEPQNTAETEQSNTTDQQNTTTQAENTGSIYTDKKENTTTQKAESTVPTQQNNNSTANNSTGTELVSSRTNRYYIILGSFSTRQNANNFAQELRNKGENNLKIIAPFNGQQRYRVAYDAYGSEAEAESKANSLRGKFGADIWVLSY